MANTKIGGYTSPHNYPGYPQQNRDSRGDWVHTERYWIDRTNVDGSIPAHNATTNQFGNTVTDPDGNTLNCRGARKDAGEAPNIVAVTLRYERITTTFGQIKLPSRNPRRLSLRGQEIPIDDKRLLDTNGGPFTSSEIEDFKKAEYLSLPLYQVHYTYGAEDSDFSWSESDVTDTLQNTGTPPGISNATPSKWRKMGLEIEERENTNLIIENWEYSEAGFKAIK